MVLRSQFSGVQTWSLILVLTTMYTLSLSYDPSIVPTDVSLQFSGDEEQASKFLPLIIDRLLNF